MHERKYTKETMPQIDFENYVSTLARKPRAFLNSPYFVNMPVPVQEHLKSRKYPELKKMLLTLVPIIREGRIGDASAVLELATIRTTDDFIVAYKALTKDLSEVESVTTALTPQQQPYLPKLDPYSALLKGGGSE